MDDGAGGEKNRDGLQPKPAPGPLAFVQSFVNTRNIMHGYDLLEDVEGGGLAGRTRAAGGGRAAARGGGGAGAGGCGGAAGGGGAGPSGRVSGGAAGSAPVPQRGEGGRGHRGPERDGVGRAPPGPLRRGWCARSVTGGVG